MHSDCYAGTGTVILKTRKRQYDPKRCIVFSQTKAPFGELSNMAAGFTVKVNGHLIRTTEALYQACRYPHLPKVQEDIFAERSPMTAKMVSRHHVKETRRDWDKIRIEVMRWCLKVKTLQHWDVLREIFRKTEGKPIVERSRKDDFWGAKETEKKTLKGVNVLGQLLMEVRERVLADDKAPTVVLPPKIPNFLLFGEPITAIRKEPISVRTQRDDTMNTIFVFGAGASIHAGYPLASKMGGELLQFMLKYPHDWFQASGRTLVEEFGESPNMEDLISDIETRIDALEKTVSYEERLLRSNLVYGRSHAAHCLRAWFQVLHKNSARLYAELADRLVKPGDTVITFNYDDSLDRELKRAGKWDLSHGYGFPLGDANTNSPVRVLKLHGSINWMLSIFGGLTSGPSFVSPSGSGALGEYPVIAETDTKYLGYSEFSGRVFTGGGVSMESLILPGRCKQFFVETSFGKELEWFWNSLWNQGAQALKKADRVVICGYSMPKADERARQLLLKHTKKDASITVLSGGDSERISREFRDAGYKDVNVIGRGYFEDLIG